MASRAILAPVETKKTPNLNLWMAGQDDEYPFTGYTHGREIARGLILDEEGNIAIHLVSRNDVFSNQTYYETPGGGVDEGESPEEALNRECEEEIGYSVEILGKLAIVEDAYNLIGRRNINHYFLAKRKAFEGKHFASEGDGFIQKTLWVSLDEAIHLYESMGDSLVAGLVKRRELPILYAVKNAKIL